MFLVYLPTWLGHKLGWMLVNIPAPWSIWVGLVFMIYEYIYTDVYECWCMFFGFITVAFEYDFFVDFDHGFHPSSCRNGFGWQRQGDFSDPYPKESVNNCGADFSMFPVKYHQISISSWRCHIRFSISYLRGWDWCPNYWGFVLNITISHICWRWNIVNIPCLVGWCFQHNGTSIPSPVLWESKGCSSHRF